MLRTSRFFQDSSCLPQEDLTCSAIIIIHCVINIVIFNFIPFPMRRLETVLLHVADEQVRMLSIFPGLSHEH